MRTYNELSEVTVTASVLDIDANPYTPITARYKVTDCRSENVLVNWTTLTPAESMTITIPGSANAMVDRNRKAETKVVTVNTNNGLASEHYEEYEYRVENLKFVGA